MLAGGRMRLARTMAVRARSTARSASRRLNTAAPSSMEVWAPRVALLALPLGTGAGLYVWRNWPEKDGSSKPSGGSYMEQEDVQRFKFNKQYKLVRSLGKGGFGEVWLAVERATGRKVAVKILSLKQLPRAMVEQEVTAMRRCGRHHNVVSLIDAVWIAPDEENQFGEAALVMDLAAGGGLFERLVDEGAYSEEYAAKILKQIAVALYHLHSRGIVHRDIKPENVVFETEDKGSTHVKLIDFGTAVALEERGEKVSTGGRIGTWSYWAPEQLQQEPYDFAVDMWSLGVLLYILLVGFHPFDPNGDGTEQQILGNMKQGNISFEDEEWERVSPKAKSLVMQLLQRDPQKRLTSAELVTHPWVCGTNVPSKPLPATHERLSAFIKARHAFYGSLLMGILAHHMAEATGAEGLGTKADGSKEFNAFEVGWKLFDQEGKGHIDSADLRRVCLEMGYKVSQRDVDNMIAVMAPTQRPLPASGGSAADGANVDEVAAAEAAASGMHAKISFERYKTTMQQSFLRRFEDGQYIFKRGDPTDFFYVITRGQVDVLVPRSKSDVPVPVGGAKRVQSVPSGRSGNVGKVDEHGDVVIASLGPGDFFGETGLLEGRDSRQASVVCRSGVEVMAMEREVFKQVAGAGAGASGNKLADSMKEKADARQRARLTKVFEMMNVAAQNRRTYAKGSVVFRQGETADHFYIVNSGTLDVSITTPDGRAVRVKRLSPGDHFGYDALLAETHDTTVTCLTDVEVTAVPQDELRLASTRDTSGYLGETMKAQRSKVSKAKAVAMTEDVEAQILPMMAKAAVQGKGSGVEYDKYEQMLAQMGTINFKSGECVFRQGDPATSFYLVTAGEWEVGTEPSREQAAAAAAAAASSRNAGGVGAGGSGGGSSSSSGADGDLRRSGSSGNRAGRPRVSGDLRVVAKLRPGDHFGETALLEERDTRNTTVRCTSPTCELREMPNETFKKCMRESKQLSASVHAAAVNRNNRRVRKVIKAAEEAGKASTVTLRPGEVLFRQGDRSSAFYLVESGKMQMSMTPAPENPGDEPSAPVVTRHYAVGDCFGASGIMAGDGYRRNTATAVDAPVTLKVIPHNYFRVMLRDDQFLKAGLRANDVLHSKKQMADEAGVNYGEFAHIYDELDDDEVKKAMAR